MAQIAPYVKTDWQDHIIDVTNGQVIQEGTRFNQKRANNFEDGIEYNRQLLIAQANEILRLKVQIEIDGRAPGNSGTFADTLDGTTNKIELETAYSDVNAAVSVGATKIPVDNPQAFSSLTQVTIYDDVSSEDVLITAVNSDSLTVQSLKNAYKKGAKVVRSSTIVDTENNKMDVGAWATYSVNLVEVV